MRETQAGQGAQQRGLSVVSVVSDADDPSRNRACCFVLFPFILICLVALIFLEAISRAISD